MKKKSKDASAATTETAQAKPAAKARRAQQGADVAPAKGKAKQMATAAKKAPTARKKASGARDGSKTAKVLELLKRTGGATAAELMEATGWQPHSVRPRYRKSASIRRRRVSTRRHF